MLRTCRKCGSRKPQKWFPENNRKGYFGYSFICLKCTKKYAEICIKKKKKKKKEWRINNADAIAMKKKEYLTAHKVQHNAYNKAWKEKNSDKVYLKNRHIIEAENFTNDYMLNLLKRTVGVSRSILKQHPEFIKQYRKQLELQRLLKTKNYETTETS